jgi:hypothetical protein
MCTELLPPGGYPIAVKYISLVTVYLNNYQKFFFSPTDTQLDNLKNNIKFALKLTLKGSSMFRCEKHHHQGPRYLSLAKVTIVKMS